jgi:predicted ATPase
MSAAALRQLRDLCHLFRSVSMNEVAELPNGSAFGGFRMASNGLYTRDAQLFHFRESCIDTGGGDGAEGVTCQILASGRPESASFNSMLTKLVVKNFRLLREVTLDIAKGKPIILIGPNASGKTSLLQVLDFLQRATDENLTRALLPFGRDEVKTAGISEPIFIELTFDPQSADPLRYQVQLQTTDAGVRIAHERLDRYEHGLDDEPRQVLVRDGNAGSIRNDSTFTMDSVFFKPDELALRTVKQKEHYPALDELSRWLSGLSIYSGFLTTPLWARDLREGSSSPWDSVVIAPVQRIDRRGFDLVNALYPLQHEVAWDELMHAFRAEFPFVSKLEFPADPAGGKIGLTWRDRRYPHVRLRASQMSEGMIAYLCLLAALLTPAPASALGFDEPDVRLHPSALRRLVSLLESASLHSAVIVATHSDRFLNFLSDPAASLRVCAPSEKGTAITALHGDVLDEWRQLYTVSQLRERGDLDPSNHDLVEP